MSKAEAVGTPNAIRLSDYSLVGKDTSVAIERGLAEASWYTSPVSKETMRELLQRRDGPAIRDTLLWFALIIGSGWAGYQLWQAGSWWAALPFMIYGVLYASTSDASWPLCRSALPGGEVNGRSRQPARAACRNGSAGWCAVCGDSHRVKPLRLTHRALPTGIMPRSWPATWKGI